MTLNMFLLASRGNKEEYKLKTKRIRTHSGKRDCPFSTLHFEIDNMHGQNKITAQEIFSGQVVSYC